ncbi:hypothetical protein SEPCBS119000_003128 [Sporothrix epigloea]|uniref:Ornithine decarboxylase antizyme n=1 Tax=Sporothrix epigloea TaxID=1892477 RepID=A0ABP0DNE2_9PEZI
MKTVFLGERTTVHNGSSLTGVYGANMNIASHLVGGGTPPSDDDYEADHGRRRFSSASDSDHGRNSFSSSVGTGSFGIGSVGASSYTTSASSVLSTIASPAAPVAWLELWDFVGCGSFRGFLAGSDEQSLFAFFDASVLSRDLKRALMALIELADSALGCEHLVICVDRRGAEALPDEAAALLKGLQWAGFSLTTLDNWTGGACVDVTSSRWIFMGMEL